MARLPVVLANTINGANSTSAATLQQTTASLYLAAPTSPRSMRQIHVYLPHQAHPTLVISTRRSSVPISVSRYPDLPAGVNTGRTRFCRGSPVRRRTYIRRLPECNGNPMLERLPRGYSLASYSGLTPLHWPPPSTLSGGGDIGRVQCGSSNVRIRTNTSFEIYNGLQTSHQQPQLSWAYRELLLYIQPHHRQRL